MGPALWFLAGAATVGVVGVVALAVWLDRAMRDWWI